MTRPEGDVLKPKDPSIFDDNDWEIFNLTNCEIWNPEGTEMVSLLEADEYNPVTVIGTLAPLEGDQRGLALQRDYHKEPVRIDMVQRFAYGEYHSGELIFWAAGKAGWFTISPADKFKSVYQNMLEALAFLYFAADTYKTRKTMKVDKLFRKYAEHRTPAVRYSKTAIDIVYHHRNFLVSSMLAGKEGVEWAGTPIYADFEQRFPEVFERLQRDKKGRRKPGRPALPIGQINATEYNTQTRRGSSARRESTAPRASQQGSPSIRQREGMNTRRTSSQNAEQQPAARRSSSLHSTSQLMRLPATKPYKPSKPHMGNKAQLMFDVMKESHSSGRVRLGQITLRRMSKILTEKLEIEAEAIAGDLMRWKATELLQLMDLDDDSQVRWSERGLYKELSAANLSPARQKEVAHLPIRPRPSTEHDDADSESDTQPRLAGKGKSALRPKTAGTASIKMSGKRKNLANEAQKLAKHRLSNDTSMQPRKRARIEADYDEEGPEATLAQTGWHAQQTPPADNHEDPFNSIPSPPAELSPSYEPNGPGDSWLCPSDGCMRKIYDARGSQGKELIRQHHAEHAGEKREQINLVYTEARPYLRVNYLVKKIQGMADKEHQQRALVSPMGFPEPIVQRY